MADEVQLIRTSAESKKISTILQSLRDCSLQPAPDFQRRAVWTNKDKVAFIQTILMGFPFPEIYIASGHIDTETGDAVDWLVDGQQRVRTIQDYFTGKSPFMRAQTVPRYRDLDEKAKRLFLGYDVAVRNLGQIEEKTIRKVFERMNLTSYSLNDMERYNAIYVGDFKKSAEILAESEIFGAWKVFSNADVRRMKDVSYTASLMATMMSDYFHRDSEVESYLGTYNDKFDERDEIERRFHGTSEFLLAAPLHAGARPRRSKADFFSLFVEVDRVLNRYEMKIDAVSAAEKLSEFYELVDQASEEDQPADPAIRTYFQATVQATNDRSARVARGEVLRAILRGCASA